MKTTSFLETVLNYSAVFLDSYGVLKNHKGVIPNIQYTLDFLRRENIAIRVLTNDASRNPALLAKRFHNQGVMGIKEEEIVTSGIMAKQYLENKIKKGKVAYLGTKRSADYIIKANVEAIPLKEITEDDYDNIKAMVFLDDEGFDWQRDINKTVNLLRHTNIPSIVANSDKIYPVANNDVSVATGGIAQLVESILGREFIHFGKPDSQMFMYAFEQLNESDNYNRSDILMVGDTLHTDILGGNKFGLDTALVFTGNTSRENAEMLIQSKGIIPNYICNSIVS